MESIQARVGAAGSHPLREQLAQVLQGGLDAGADADALAETMLAALATLGLVNYAPPHTLGLLSSPGRVLVAVAERPDVRLREIGAYLGIGESAVAHNVSAVVRAGLITRTKVKGRNHYRLNLTEIAAHPDVVRFARALRMPLADPS